MRIIGGKFRGRTLKTPKGAHIRPTTGLLRSTVFNILQSCIAEARVLDLFAGAGAIGLEALSRGAKSATFVDSDKEAIRIIKENLQTLGLEGRVMQLDVMKAIDLLAKKGETFDLVYIDPPYGKGLGERTLEKVTGLLVPGGLCFLEEEEKEVAKPVHLELLSERRVGRSILREYQQL